MGFFNLPYASETLARTQELADGYGQWFENVVILGIGGSALGARTLRDALLGPLWNEKDDEAREHFPRIYVLDNVDPDTVRDLLSHVDIRRTLFNVVSKSGTTAETMALYLVLEGLLIDEVGPDRARGHFLFTTDPTDGPLRAIAEGEGIPSLPIPPNVGGASRYCRPWASFPPRWPGSMRRRSWPGPLGPTTAVERRSSEKTRQGLWPRFCTRPMASPVPRSTC